MCELCSGLRITDENTRGQCEVGSISCPARIAVTFALCPGAAASVGSVTPRSWPSNATCGRCSETRSPMRNPLPERGKPPVRRASDLPRPLNSALGSCVFPELTFRSYKRLRFSCSGCRCSWGEGPEVGRGEKQIPDREVEGFTQTSLNNVFKGIYLGGCFQKNGL